MAFGPGQFRAALTGGGARPTLFEVTMAFPVAAPDPAASTKMTFTCEAASLPSDTVGSIILPYFGRQTKWPGDRVFEDWNVTIINDEDFLVKKAFERWLSALNSHNGNLRSQAAATTAGFGVDAYIKQYGKTGDSIKGYRFIGMFPTAITPIEVGWAATDQIERFSVTLSYQWWESDTTDGQGDGLNG
jgi:hypothetical protein